MSLEFVLICSLLGAVAGLMAGLLGIGGGLVIVPMLVILLPWFQIVSEPHIMIVAVATSLGSVIITSLSSVTAHHRLGNIPWRTAVAVMAGAGVGALLFSSIAALIDPWWLKKFFAVAVFLIGLNMLLTTAPVGIFSLPARRYLLLLSTAPGGVASLLGIGGGALFVPLLNLLSVDMRRAIGTAATSGLFIAMAGSIGYVHSGWALYAVQDGFLGFIYVPAVLGIVLTSVWMAPVGAALTSRLPVMTIKRVFGLFLWLVSARMMLS